MMTDLSLLDSIDFTGIDPNKDYLIKIRFKEDVGALKMSKIVDVIVKNLNDLGITKFTIVPLGLGIESLSVEERTKLGPLNGSILEGSPRGMSSAGHTCKICGKVIPEPAPYCIDVCSSECFNENFWNEALDDSAIIINGECYHIADEHARGPRGHAGRKFEIKILSTGETIVTTNLWYQGVVPPERGVKDNAVFI